MATDFATNPTDSSSFGDAIYSAIITDMVLDALMAAVVTPQLVAHYDLRGQASKAVDIVKADKFTAADLTEGTEVQNTELTETKATLTAAETGIQATITDVLDVSDIPAAQPARLRQLGRSMADKVDVDIAALSASAGSNVGTSGSALTLADVLEAIMNLEVNDAPKPFAGLLHPYQVADVRDEFTAQSVAVFSSQGIQAGTNELGPAAQPGRFGEWLGIDFYFSTNVPTANAAADRGGMIFSRGYALGMVEKWAAKVVPMYWPPIRGWVLTATAMYGVGVIESDAVVSVTTDNG